MKRIALSDHFGYGRLLRFSLPSIIMIVFTSLYTIVDGIFVSNLVGSTAFAALNLIYPAVGILGAFGFMIGSGGAALVSKTLGEKEHHKANEYFTMLIVFEIILGLVVGTVGALTLRPVALFLGATEELMPDCLKYGTILMFAQVFFFLTNSFQSFLVVAERPKMGLAITLCAGFSNMILDYIFIAVFQMGIFGAALATAMNWVLGALVPLFFFLRRNGTPLKLIPFRWHFAKLGTACLNGSSEMVTNLSLNLVAMLYNFELMRIAGPDGVIAYGVIQYMTFVFLAIFLGYTMAVSPVVSYHYGAGNRHELKSLLKKSLTIIAVFALSMLAIAESTSGFMATVFVSGSKTLMEMTMRGIEIYSISFLITGFNIFVSGFFTALNNGPVSAIVSFFRTFFSQVVFILILPIWFGLNGIWSAVIVSEGVSLLVSFGFLKGLQKKYGY